MTQPPAQPPTWGGQTASGMPPGQPDWRTQTSPGMPAGQPDWRTQTSPGMPASPPAWQQPGAPQVPPQAGPPAWEQRPGPPAGPPPGGSSFGTPPPQRSSRRGLWWSLGALVVVLLVGAGVFVFVLMRGVDAPTGVEASVQPDGVTVTWQAVDGAASYEVFRNGDSVGTTEGTSFVDAEAPGGTEHTYAVIAADADGEKSETAAAAAAVLAPVDAPVGLAATVDGGQVTLTWEAVTGADRYEVRADGAVEADDLTDVTYTDTDATFGDHVYEVTAVDVDGAGSTASATVDAFSTGPWSEGYEIALAFPELVGTTPDEGGWSGSSCALDPVEGTQALIYCTYADGVYIEVSQFTDTGQRDARIGEIRGVTGVQSGTWSYGSGDAQGDVYVGAADASTAWRFITFYESDRELFTIYAEWEGHSQEELRDGWFAQAPF